MRLTFTLFCINRIFKLQLKLAIHSSCIQPTFSLKIMFKKSLIPQTFEQTPSSGEVFNKEIAYLFSIRDFSECLIIVQWSLTFSGSWGLITKLRRFSGSGIQHCNKEGVRLACIQFHSIQIFYIEKCLDNHYS